jgi:hypothetical protein
LRGEHAEVYVDGTTRHAVCELCTSRALHGGWVREGTIPAYDESSARPDRRRSLLGRFRGRRDGAAGRGGASDERDGEGQGEDAARFELAPPPPRPEPADDGGSRSRSAGNGAPRSRPGGGRSRPVRAARSLGNSAGRGGSGREPGSREPRHVRAVPTSIEHKIASAVAEFNASEHPRTVAGITRSLGLPDVSVHPSDATGSSVCVIVAWELCWYRYEVDLSDEVPSMRVAGQGYELDELSALDRQLNAAADDRGQLTLGD